MEPQGQLRRDVLLLAPDAIPALTVLGADLMNDMEPMGS
jgi:hypothetical protein